MWSAHFTQRIQEAIPTTYSLLWVRTVHIFCTALGKKDAQREVTTSLVESHIARCEIKNCPSSLNLRWPSHNIFTQRAASNQMVKCAVHKAVNGLFLNGCAEVILEFVAFTDVLLFRICPRYTRHLISHTTRSI